MKKNLELKKITNAIYSNYVFFSEKTKIKFFIRKEKSTNTGYTLRNIVMVGRDRLMVEKSKDTHRILEVNADTLNNI